jgi:hypothetical protein
MGRRCRLLGPSDQGLTHGRHHPRREGRVMSRWPRGDAQIERHSRPGPRQRIRPRLRGRPVRRHRDPCPTGPALNNFRRALCSRGSSPCPVRRRIPALWRKSTVRGSGPSPPEDGETGFTSPHLRQSYSRLWRGTGFESAHWQRGNCLNAGVCAWFSAGFAVPSGLECPMHALRNGTLWHRSCRRGYGVLKNGTQIEPSSAMVNPGLWATFQAWPSGSVKIAA